MELKNESTISTFLNVLLIHAIKINITKYSLDMALSVARTSARLLPNRLTEASLSSRDISRLAVGHQQLLKFDLK